MRVSGEYVVSFNTRIGQYEVGESSEDTVDFVGNDIDELAVEVIESDPSFPLTFERVTDNRSVVGVFRDKSYPDDIVAVMVPWSVMM